MFSSTDREAVKECLRRLGTPVFEINARIAALNEVASLYRRRLQRRAESALIGEVLAQLSLLEHAALQARLGREVVIPLEILPETFSALIGDYPFSSVDLAPVTLETLRNPKRQAGLFKTAVVGATVEPHVFAAAMRQVPGEPHLVAVRTKAFCHAPAKEFFFGGLSEPADADLRRRLETFIIKMSDVAPEFISMVREGVYRATRDPERQNPGGRSLYSWAEPSPDGRLVFDVCEIVLEPTIRRPGSAVRSIVIELVSLLANAGMAFGCGAERDVRDDICSSMLTIWVALNLHRTVEQRLSGILGGMPLAGSLVRQQRQRRRLLALRDVVRESTAELERRGEMGDHAHVKLVRGNDRVDGKPAGATSARRTLPNTHPRATGFPVSTLSLTGVAEAKTDPLFVLKLARACKSYMQAS